MEKKTNYRKAAFDKYGSLCAYCGFGIRNVLEIAHIDGNPNNNDLTNLVVLCPTCHRMHDIDLISTEIMIEIRDRPKVPNQKKRMKDAGAKAWDTRKRRAEALRRKRRTAAKKAVATRQHNRLKGVRLKIPGGGIS